MVRNARTLWLFSFMAGIAVLIGSFMTRDSHLERLRSVVQGMAPGGDADAVGTAAIVVFWGSLAAVLAVILLEAAILAVVMGRQAWARWVLFLLLAGHVGVLLVTADFLVPGGDAGTYVVLLWGLDLLLALAGLVFFFTRQANGWLRSGR
jgi:LPXTG-motif cell wall-anchored protein